MATTGRELKRSTAVHADDVRLLYVIRVVCKDEIPANRDGPGGIRTLDLGIKSPTTQAVTSRGDTKRPAPAADHRCKSMHSIAASGDKPVRHLVRHVRSRRRQHAKRLVSFFVCAGHVCRSREPEGPHRRRAFPAALILLRLPRTGLAAPRRRIRDRGASPPWRRRFRRRRRVSRSSSKRARQPRSAAGDRIARSPSSPLRLESSGCPFMTATSKPWWPAIRRSGRSQ